MSGSERGAENATKNARKKFGNVLEDVIDSLNFFNYKICTSVFQSHYTLHRSNANYSFRAKRFLFLTSTQKSENIPVSEVVAAVVVG